MNTLEKHAVPIVVVVTLLLSIALGAVIVLSTQGEPGLTSWDNGLQVTVNSGHHYIFVTWHE